MHQRGEVGQEHGHAAQRVAVQAGHLHRSLTWWNGSGAAIRRDSHRSLRARESVRQERTQQRTAFKAECVSTVKASNASLNAMNKLFKGLQ